METYVENWFDSEIAGKDQFSLVTESFKHEYDNFNKMLEVIEYCNESSDLSIEIVQEGFVEKIKELWEKFIKFWKTLFDKIKNWVKKGGVEVLKKTSKEIVEDIKEVDWKNIDEKEVISNLLKISDKIDDAEKNYSHPNADYRVSVPFFESGGKLYIIPNAVVKVSEKGDSSNEEKIPSIEVSKVKEAVAAKYQNYLDILGKALSNQEDSTKAFLSISDVDIYVFEGEDGDYIEVSESNLRKLVNTLIDEIQPKIKALEAYVEWLDDVNKYVEDFNKKFNTEDLAKADSDIGRLAGKTIELLKDYSRASERLINGSRNDLGRSIKCLTKLYSVINKSESKADAVEVVDNK